MRSILGIGKGEAQQLHNLLRAATRLAPWLVKGFDERIGPARARIRKTMADAQIKEGKLITAIEAMELEMPHVQTPEATEEALVLMAAAVDVAERDGLARCVGESFTRAEEILPGEKSKEFRRVKKSCWVWPGRE
jgi:hypothetical protein